MTAAVMPPAVVRRVNAQWGHVRLAVEQMRARGYGIRATAQRLGVPATVVEIVWADMDQADTAAVTR